MKVAKRVEQLPPSGIRAFFDLVLGMEDVISLGVGEPDFITPWHVIESAVYSIEKGATSYTSNKGLHSLRQAIAGELQKRFRLTYDTETQILITVGVSEAYDLAVRAVINPGDKVLIPEPCYVSYAPLVSLAGGVPVYLHTDVRNDFKIAPVPFKKALKGMKALVLNYPCNPTGSSYTKKELQELSAILGSTDTIIISDEIYGELTYDFEHTPFPTLPGMQERTVYLNGFSKAYAMTGWRVGYAAGPAAIIGAMTKIHQYTILCAPIMAQIAAHEAMRNGTKACMEMKKEYQRRRDFMVHKLNEIGLTCTNPAGAFYFFPSIKGSGYHSLEFANALLEEEKVAVVPGIAFGPSGEDHVRISYASSMDNLKEALERIKNFLSRAQCHVSGSR